MSPLLEIFFETYQNANFCLGYYEEGFKAIIVFCSCYLPDKKLTDYDYIMDNLFLYVISTLELLVIEDYMIVFFHGASPKNKMPSLVWLKKCCDMIDKKLKKNLSRLLIVHPTIWLKTLFLIAKPFYRYVILLFSLFVSFL